MNGINFIQTGLISKIALGLVVAITLACGSDDSDRNVTDGNNNNTNVTDYNDLDPDDCPLLPQSEYSSGGVIESGSCYQVQGFFTVDSGTLVIEDNVQLFFSGTSKFQVVDDGTIDVQGKEDREVLMTSLNDDRWRGLEFTNSRGDNNIEYAIIEKTKIPQDGIYSLRRDAGSVSPGRLAIDVWDSNLDMSKSIIRDVHIGLSIKRAWNVEEASNVIFDHNRIDQLSEAPIHATISELEGIGPNNSFEGGYEGHNVIFLVDNHSDTIFNDEIVLRNLELPYVVGFRQENHTIYVHSEGQLTIEPGTVIEFYERSRLHADGPLIADAGGEEQITFRGVDGTVPGLTLMGDNVDHVLRNVLIDRTEGPQDSNSAWPMEVGLEPDHNSSSDDDMATNVLIEDTLIRNVGRGINVKRGAAIQSCEGLVFEEVLEPFRLSHDHDGDVCDGDYDNF